MGILNKIGDASKSVTERTIGMADLGNLKRKIAYEEERILEIFGDIGRIYYKSPQKEDELKDLCKDIDVRRRRIRKMKFEMQGLKGKRACPTCQSEVPEKYSFCGVCGKKFPISEDDFD